MMMMKITTSMTTQSEGYEATHATILLHFRIKKEAISAMYSHTSLFNDNVLIILKTKSSDMLLLKCRLHGNFFLNAKILSLILHGVWSGAPEPHAKNSK